MIKAIETEYKGYKFRSRLEARWAVFFDELNIAYQYEPEGFDKGNGVKWLPDFYLTDLDMYVEVKGTDEQLRKDFYKLGAFVDWEGPLDQQIMILGNIPDYNEIENAGGVYYWLPAFIKLRCNKGVYGDYVTFRIDETDEVYISDMGVEPNLDWDCEACAFEDTDYSEQIKNGEEIGWFNDDDFTINDELISNKCCDYKEVERLRKAYKKARQARFEHGETP